LIALLLTILLMSGWEAWWRSDGSVPGYRNSEGLWAIQRRRINDGEGHKTIITGSSRIFFDTQLDVWEEESGQRPIQLALEGTSPATLMEGLIDDLDFYGYFNRRRIAWSGIQRLRVSRRGVHSLRRGEPDAMAGATDIDASGALPGFLSE